MSDPVGRTNFAQLYLDVGRLIDTGGYRPGDRIAVSDLAARLHVSTTPLREVLSRLVGRGVVEERRSEGYYVTRLDAGDIANLYRHHLLCVEQALRRPIPSLRLALIDVDDWWPVLDRLIMATDDHILLGVRRFLAEQLRLLQRGEILVLGDPVDHGRRIKAYLLAGDVTGTRVYCRLVHRQLARAAPEIARASTAQHY